MTAAVLAGGDSLGREGVRRVAVLAAATLALLAFMLIDLVTGASGLPLATVLQALRAGPHGADQGSATILWQLRMPQTLTGVLVGASLGLSGLVMQTILANPLASPYTLGFSAAAGFGAALAIMFGGLLPVAVWLLVPASAFAMTLLACGLIYAISRYRGASPEVLVLAGIAVLFFFQSLQSLLQFLAAPEVLQQIVFWLFGSLLKSSWTSVQAVALILCVTVPLLARDVWRLTTLRLGEANAASLGLDIDRLRRRCFVIVALLTAGAVSFTGTIGFIGLIAPHVARRLVGEDHRFALPLASLAGAAILVGASVIGKAISPGAVVPVGIITAVTGIPMLLAVILQEGDRR